MWTAELVRELLDYNPETGWLTWKVWVNSRAHAGYRAGSLDRKGYRAIQFGGVRRLEHRLVWLWVHGEWPPEELDHINGNRSDNRICNLRPATCRQNHFNLHVSWAKSGYRNVEQRGKAFRAYVTLGQRKRRWLGSFSTAEEAAAVAKKAREELHGEFAA